MSALENCPYRCEQELCACCELSVNRLKKLDTDHVSKKALRKWCEFEISWWSNEHAGYDERLRLCMLAMHREILGRFCKEGER